MTSLTNAEEHFVSQAIVSFAGNLAEKRARRGSGPGWERMLTDKQAVAIHEAAHAIAAVVRGRFVYRVSITARADVEVSGKTAAGHMLSGRDPEPPQPFGPIQCVADHTKAAQAAWLLTPWDVAPRWRHVLATARALRLQASAIVEEAWPFISALAGELQKHGELDRAAIEGIIWGRTSDV